MQRNACGSQRSPRGARATARFVAVLLLGACSSAGSSPPSPDNGGGHAGSLAGQGGGAQGGAGAAGDAGVAGSAGDAAPGSSPDAVADRRGEDDVPQPLPGSAGTCTPLATQHLFVDAIAESAWHTINLVPAGGMRAIADQLARLATEELDRPVRLRLAPGTYQATDVGQGELYVEGLQRSAAAPLLIQAVDPAPDATRLGQGFNLVGVSFLAFDGLTIGPPEVGTFHGGDFCVVGGCYHDLPRPLDAEAGFHVSGVAAMPMAAGLKDGHLDYTVYGRYLPAHDVVIRRATIQNLFGDDEPSGAAAAGGGSDGIKFNQASNVWVIDSRIRQISRHGIDNVGVHGACFIGNVIADTGVGLGIEAKGSSIDVTIDGNVFINVRRLELGGQSTDAVHHWSAELPGTPLHYAYEGRRIVARNNLIVDPRAGGLEFSGCQDCAAIGNTLLYHAAFASDEGGDAVREIDSAINREDAGSACAAANGDEITECWNVGPYPMDLVQVTGDDGVSRPLTNARNTLANNLFLNATGKWGFDLPPYTHVDPDGSYGLTTVDYNHWWNAGNQLMDPGDGTWLMDGVHSVFADSTGSGGVDVALVLDPTRVDVAATARAGLRPRPGTAVVGKGGVAFAGYASYDAAGKDRPNPPSIGALEP
jgi:hypothetical protein